MVSDASKKKAAAAAAKRGGKAAAAASSKAAAPDVQNDVEKMADMKISYQTCTGVTDRSLRFQKSKLVTSPYFCFDSDRSLSPTIENKKIGARSGKTIGARRSSDDVGRSRTSDSNDR